MLNIAGKKTSIINGGMGAGISTKEIAGKVAKRGGIGTLSSVALDWFVSRRVGYNVTPFQAAKIEVQEARRLSENRGTLGMNVMVKIPSLYEPSVKGAIAGGVDIIFAGAGLPSTLPEIAGNAPVALVPIVSSARALKIICEQWAKRYNGRKPDGVVLEGPLAGGHLGFDAKDIDNPDFQLEKLFPPVKDVAEKNGNFPVYVAGGIYTHEDILKWIERGADGVQLGTRFAATYESGASEEFKRAIIAATEKDIEVAVNPGSPAGMPFRVITFSPGYQEAIHRTREPFCDKQYLLYNDKCAAMEKDHRAFCICNALLSAAGCNNTSELPIFTVGANAARIEKIISVDELMNELITGEVQ